MYLLLDHIKGKNYLLYKIERRKKKKKKRRVIFNFHCSSLCYRA